MRELAILEFVTLDGVMQAPSSPEEDGSGGFTQGGWANAYWQDVMPEVMREAMSEPYDIVFGRKTYEIFAGHWPSADPEDPVANMLNKARKYVATNTLTDISWENTVALNGDAVAEVARLKAMDGPLLQIHGSGNLVQSLVEADLVDEFRLWIFPLVVGGGKRLFGGEGALQKMDLRKSTAHDSGVVMAIYRRRLA